jgi:hypothetical protein
MEIIMAQDKKSFSESINEKILDVYDSGEVFNSRNFRDVCKKFCRTYGEVNQLLGTLRSKGVLEECMLPDSLHRLVLHYRLVNRDKLLDMISPRKRDMVARLRGDGIDNMGLQDILDRITRARLGHQTHAR